MLLRANLTGKTIKGQPDHEDLLQQLFGGIVVDGSGACAPGEELGVHEVPTNYIPEDTVTYVSPPSSYVSKRPSQRSNASTATSPTSPQKRTKNPMVKVMQGIHETLKNKL